MRILVITNELPSMSQATRARPARLASVARQIESLRNLGAEIEVLQIAGLRKLKYLQAVVRLWRTVRNVDVVHGHYGFCGWVARCQWSKPVMVSFMGSDLLGWRDMQGRIRFRSRIEVQANKLLARVVDAVVVKTSEMARVVSARAHVIPNGVDLDTFRPLDRGEARARLQWNPAGHYVLFPGNPYWPGKGFPLARSVVHTTAQRVDHVELVCLYGVAPDDVPLVMNACDGVLMTSFSEGSPNVIKEAMACNVPIVSVAVGDVPQLLDGVESCAICAREVSSLADALVAILQSGRRSNGRQKLWAQGLDAGSVACRLMSLYEFLAAGFSTRLPERERIWQHPFS